LLRHIRKVFNMESEEKIIYDKFGQRTPFKVPKGYFDNFASQLMDALPEHGAENQSAQLVVLKPSFWHRYRYGAVAAASVCAVIFGVGVLLHQNHHEQPTDDHKVVSSTSASSSYTAVDALADYTMMDTGDMYAYMQDID